MYDDILKINNDELIMDQAQMKRLYLKSYVLKDLALNGHSRNLEY